MIKIETHKVGNKKVAEILSDQTIIYTVDDGLELMGNLYYQNFDQVILHEKNISADFFDLKTGIAGGILQKFAQYRFPLTIVGDFTKYESKSLKDFIFESNKGTQINFLFSTDEALIKLR